MGVAGKVQANESDKLKLATVMREKLSYTQIELKPRKSIFHHFATIQVFSRGFINSPNSFTFSCGEKLRNFLFILWEMIKIWSCRSHEENTAL